ncbi:ubiquitin-like-conjugating enzyme ATG10 [Chenopodium quinoa]|uniref:Ubiquitin-like-conjugating enzyme ATG10 n=1 Tax=Chenopodium quinoa TaxID=63459 RepID=A0A803L879_CHEQI|nr:ubiquitin-like-conjugating enzyme ATG10 [Chenopodium quinoa]XP_021733471.1 ubiquitin-like-conjugating enzyme ATG10 [Chenopodium quinoa]XP_021733472.1 ubiquitin-like-conjugating enzyme ATG10 [Chenopodium quinoa]
MMNSEKSKWDGTISPDEFLKGALAFAEKWKKVCLNHNHDLPNWFWVSCLNPPFLNSHEVDGYLSLEKMCILRSDKIDDEKVGYAVEEMPNCLESEECTDPARLVQEAAQEVHYYDFHIVYSNSYRIPVLYFRGYNSDGQTLLLDQIERDLPPRSVEVLTESKWTFITQQEHPYLNRPWHTLHPCGTNELMKLLLSNTSLSEDKVGTECYIISWLSVVSQVVGLRVPLQMAALCHE